VAVLGYLFAGRRTGFSDDRHRRYNDADVIRRLPDHSRMSV
jgi:hypothetical protein